MSGRRRLFGVLASSAGALILAAGPVAAQVPEGARLPVAEEHDTATLPEPGPHWVYIVEPVFPHLVASKVWIVDGDELDVIGTVSAGYTANMALAPDAGRLYLAETYWSRGTRGERTDVVTTYDARTLEATDEVILPEGRFLVVTKKNNAALTPDGRYLLSFNMDPATTVSVVDLESQSYVTDIETPGCALVYPFAPTRFAMPCADGSLLTVDFEDPEDPEISRGEPFFDAEDDPVFEHVAFSRQDNVAYFVSYGGTVYPVDFSGDAPQAGESWSLLTDDETGTWWPGGWQLVAYHPGTNRLFVQMHEGAMWTHKVPGDEVWVFDAETGERLERITMAIPAWSLIVTLDDEPLLFTVDGGGVTSVYDATSYEHRGDIEETGISPHILHVVGE